MNPAQKKRIIREEQTSNPLYLRTLLEELRVFGIYQDLDKEIEQYLKAETLTVFSAWSLRDWRRTMSMKGRGL